jgi:hypothetical protein
MTARQPVLVTRPLLDQVLRFLEDHCDVTRNREDRPMDRD